MIDEATDAVDAALFLQDKLELPDVERVSIITKVGIRPQSRVGRGAPVARNFKDARTESRLEKTARDNARVPQYETTIQAIRKKTARLKALRLAKQASEKKS